MIESESRLADSTRTLRRVVASAVFTRDRIGVTPLPPQKATSGAVLSRRQNTPAGSVVSIRSPGRRFSCIQFETRPPGTRFTVVISSESVSGELDIE